MESGVEIEARILGVFRRRENYYKYRKILQDTFFQTAATRYIFTFIDDFFSSGKTDLVKLTIPELRIIAHQKIRSKEQLSETLKTLKIVRKYETLDNEVIEGAIKDFVKRQLVKMAILKGLEELDKPTTDFQDIHDTIGKALAVTTEGQKGYYSYFEGTLDRINPDNEEHKIKTFSQKLDDAMDGGCGTGELIVVLAPPERGKTLVLVNFAAQALYQGLTVGYFTLELAERKIARRFDLRISGRPISLLRKDPTKIKSPLQALRNNGCNLVIKDYSSEYPKVEDIKSFIITYQNRMKKNFDMIIIDYADLVAPSHQHKQERFGIKEVYTGLRRLANEFKIPVITASQANRRSVEKAVITMADFAEDFQKAAIADVVLAICQTPEELEEDLARIYIAKNRSSGKHLLFRVQFKSKVMFIGEGHAKDE